MGKPKVKSKWVQGPGVAEYAEVLAVRTDQVMAAMVRGKRAIVFYTPGDGTSIWQARMERDADGIYQLRQVPRAVADLDNMNGENA